MDLKMILYVVGGLFLYLGVYCYLKTRGSVGMSPLPGTAVAVVYQLCGTIGGIGMLAYLIGAVILFSWWLAPLFFVVGGLAVGAIYSKVTMAAAGLAIVCVPLGITLAAIAAFLPDSVV